MEKLSAISQAAPMNVQNLSDEQKAQVRKAIIEQAKVNQSNQLERSPEISDQYVGAASPQKMYAAISPTTIVNGAVALTGVIVALQNLARAGFDIWDMFTERFGKPQSKEEETALKQALCVEA